MPLKNISSTQQVASNTQELVDSYNQLYQEWMGQHRNILQAKQFLDLLNVSSGLLLDVACGLGFLLNMAQERGATGYGIDLAPVPLKMSKTEDPGRRLVLGDGESLPWLDNTFDYITSLGSLEHYIHPDIGIQEISRVLKPTGLAAINLPNSHHLQAIYNVYKTGGILPDLQDYERFATRVEWQTLLENNGLDIISVHKFNTGFSRLFKKGREGFWYFYNIMFRLFKDHWIPVNLSFSLTFICKKSIPLKG